jgi:hypothetical protein
MRLRLLGALAAIAVAIGSSISGTSAAGAQSWGPSQSAHTLCSSGYVQAHLSWGDKCLRAGEFCKVGNPEYHAYGFDCPADGHLTYYAPASTATPTTTVSATTTSAVTTTAATTTSSTSGSPTRVKTCSVGYVSANLPWGHKCLHAGEFCKIGNAAYRRYGFTCPASGHLRRR